MNIVDEKSEILLFLFRIKLKYEQYEKCENLLFEMGGGGADEKCEYLLYET